MSDSQNGAADESGADAARQDAAANEPQRIVRVAGSRRARLTPVPGTDPSPDVPAKPEHPVPRGARGTNDEQLFRDIPPHY
ncbi:hypothetical protein [Microbacterium sp.]|uniref:hypothetical protein n=1 Tax=Microbacterium sp. TaxID=51671 RepID=UPI003F9688A4